MDVTQRTRQVSRLPSTTMTSPSGTAPLCPRALSTPRERMRDAALARVRAIAHARGATMGVVVHGDYAELDSDDETGRCVTLPRLIRPGGCTAVPRRVLIATDFSESSLCAAHAALEVAPDAEIHLVHVCPRRWCCRPGEARDGTPARLDEPFASLFAALQTTLRAPAARFTRVILDGDPADALLEDAQRRCVDLIALGVHGHTSIQEHALGLVTERVLCEASCSVLVSGFEPRPERDVSTTPATPQLA